jgi:murein DD-endopeptidase MepM/ murein hydrolase activator NlpD
VRLGFVALTVSRPTRRCPLIDFDVMRARLCLALLSLVLGAWMPAEPRVTTYVPVDQGEWDPGLTCTGRLDIPFVQNVIEAKWSPDSKKLALTTGQRTPSLTTPLGWKEEEFVYTIDVRTGVLTPVGAGIRPEWSTTGKYLSYWPEDEDLRVMRGGKIEAKLLMSIPEVRWVGDKLLYILRRDIREWANGEIRTIARFDKDFEPAYPMDDVYWSPDGTRFTLTRYSYDGGVERYIGTTATATLEPLDVPGAMHMEWSPTGNTLLVRYPNRLDLIAADGVKLSTPLSRFAGPIASWTADGRSLVVGRLSSTLPAGDRFEKFAVWGAPQSSTTATLPNLVGARAFSPDGRYFTGVSRERLDTTRLEVYRCGTWSEEEWNVQGDPEAEARLGRIENEGLRFLRPVPGDVAQFRQYSHTGVDVAAPVGSIIVAADGGTISKVGWQGVGGQGVCVSHGGGLETCYFHTSGALVGLGQRVVRGQPIALVGMTGVTSGPHVHWEAKLFGEIVDPLAR